MGVTTSESWAEAVGGRVRQARRRRGWSLERAVAESAGRFKAATLSSYERGDRQITLGVLYGLADLYGVPVQALLPGCERFDETDERLVAHIAHLPDERRAVVVALVEQLMAVDELA